MGKIRQALHNWYSGEYKNIHKAALAAGCASSAPVYRAIRNLENNPRLCPCCEQSLDSRVPLPQNRFAVVREFLDKTED